MFSDVQEDKNDWRIIRVPILALLVTMVLMLASSSQASAQNKLIPEIKLGDANIKLWGILIFSTTVIPMTGIFRTFGCGQRLTTGNLVFSVK